MMTRLVDGSIIAESDGVFSTTDEEENEGILVNEVVHEIPPENGSMPKQSKPVDLDRKRKYLSKERLTRKRLCYPEK